MEEKIEQVNFTVSLTKKDLVSYSFFVFLRRPLIIAIYLVWLVVIAKDTITDFVHYDTIPYSFWFFLFFLLLFPCLIYWGGLHTYKNNLRLREKMIYTINRSDVEIEGESFTTTYSIDKIYKISESKKYFYIWVQKHSANIIPKRYLKPEDIEFLKSIK